MVIHAELSEDVVVRHPPEEVTEGDDEDGKKGFFKVVERDSEKFRDHSEDIAFCCCIENANMLIQTVSEGFVDKYRRTFWSRFSLVFVCRLTD